MPSLLRGSSVEQAATATVCANEKALLDRCRIHVAVAVDMRALAGPTLDVFIICRLSGAAGLDGQGQMLVRSRAVHRFG